MRRLALTGALLLGLGSASGCGEAVPPTVPAAPPDAPAAPPASPAPAPGGARPCTGEEVEALVGDFVRAFNRGKAKALDRLFAREPGFEWYSTGPPGARFNRAAYNRSTLLAYFAARHERGERLRLRSFRFNGNADEGGGVDPYGNFEYGLVRSADDLPPARYYGKGAARCYDDRAVIFVWSMAPQ